MEFDFKGQTAIVTGGTRGIGSAISAALLKSGAKVHATYRSNEEEAKKFKESKDFEDFVGNLNVYKEE